MKYFDAQAIDSGLAMPACLEAMRTAFLLSHRGGISQPPRQITALPNDVGMAFMPGALNDSPWVGAKVVVRWPPDEVGGPFRKAGVFLLFDANEASLCAAFDAHALTLHRTAAATVVATEALARRGDKRIGIIGTGQLARAHLRAFAAHDETRQLLVWGRRPAAARTLCAELDFPVPTEPVADLAELLRRADVICTVSAAREPVLTAHQLRNGQHLNLVGSSTAQDHEVPAEIVTRGPVWVDDLASAKVNAAELKAAVASGLLQWQNLAGSIGGVLAGDHPGRQNDDQITIFKSLGLFAEDVLAAQLLAGLSPHQGEPSTR